MKTDVLDGLRLKAAEVLTLAGKVNGEDRVRYLVSTEQLRVSLTQDELLDTADELAQALIDIEKANNELESIKSSYKSKLKELEGRMEQLRGRIRDKFDIRKVDCVEMLNNTTGQATKVRMDTEEVCEERKMTANERQGTLWEENLDAKDIKDKVDEETGELKK